jgi:hypothetical protein
MSNEDSKGGKVLQFKPESAPSSPQTPEPQVVNFKTFHDTVQSGDLKNAGRMLGILLGLSEETGSKGAKYYQSKLSADPMHMMKTMRLRSVLSEGSSNDALAHITDCFGVSGPEALAAVEKLKASY